LLLQLAKDLAVPRGRLSGRGRPAAPAFICWWSWFRPADRGEGSRMFDVRRRQFITLLARADEVIEW